VSQLDMHRVERVREVIPRCRQPFDTRAVCTLLGSTTKPNDNLIRNSLSWLCRRGELEQHYVRKGRRRNAVVFTTTAEFGQRKATPEEILASMARLDAALRGWRRDRAQRTESRP